MLSRLYPIRWSANSGNCDCLTDCDYRISSLKLNWLHLRDNVSPVQHCISEEEVLT